MRIGLFEVSEEFERGRLAPGKLAGDRLAHSIARHRRTFDAVREVLEDEGHEVTGLPVDYSLPECLRQSRIDMVFNIYFGPGKRQDQASIAAIMDFAGIPYSGGNAFCHMLGLSKPFSKMIFRAYDIPTPKFFEYPGPEATGSPQELCLKLGMRFPLIVKTSLEGEGIGIDANSIVWDAKGLVQAIDRVLADYNQPALVEEFINGREFTVGVLGNESPTVLPVMELILESTNGAPGIYSYDVKANETANVECPARIPSELMERMGFLAIRAGKLLHCRDFWRVDFRIDEGGNPFVLEVNTLPGLQPHYSDLPQMAEKGGIPYQQLIHRILSYAMERIHPAPSR